MDELKIIQYLDGEMSGEEKKAFEEEISENPPLAEELERYRKLQELAVKLLADHEDEIGPGTEMEQEIDEAVENFKRNKGPGKEVPQEYLEELRKAESRYTGDKKESTLLTIRRVWYRTAALIVLALLASILIFRPFEKLSPDEVYSEYFRPYHKTEKMMEMARENNDFLFAVEVYESGDYERALDLFNRLDHSSLTGSWSTFYTACSYMALHQSTKAIPIFKDILDEGVEEILTHTHWQLALCYIRNGEPALAREHLEVLRADPEYRRDAGRIIRILY